jgi:Tol biopolymer transport system component/DNA-binding winged helix-turn-helix (wHTH) protein
MGSIRFGVFEADLDTGELRKNGRRIRIQDQPFRVLSILLEQPGRLVTREELREKLWPADTYVDFDRSLNTTVAKLRSALGDSGDSPRFIETLPRRGYRFLGEVEIVALDDGQKRPATWTMVLLAATVLTAVIVITAIWHGQTTPESPVVVLPLTSYPGDERHPSLSPDGNQVAFAWKKEGSDNYDIYTQVIGSGEPRQLTSGPADDLTPSWSPDGRYIAFFRLTAEKVAVLLIHATGGREQVLTEPIAQPHFPNSPWIAWRPEGEQIVVPYNPGREKGGPGLFRVSITTREAVRLTSQPPKTHGDAGPALSPDGRTLAFTRILSGGAKGLYLLALTEELEPAGEPVELRVAPQLGGLAWIPDTREIVVQMAAGRSTDLWRLSVDGEAAPGRLAWAGAAAGGAAISRRGGRLVFVRRAARADIWQHDLREPKIPSRIVSSTRWDAHPHFSPDGQKIVFVSDRQGTEELWVCDSDGSSPARLTPFGGPHVQHPRWSPDGKQIAFTMARGGKANDLFVMPSGGGAERQLTMDPANDGVPAWSPDGQWIYFRSNRGGKYQVWRIPSEGGTTIQVTQHGGGPARVAPDGRFVYYFKMSPGPRRLWKVPADGGEETPVVDHFSMGAQFEVVKRGVYFISAPDDNGQYYLSLFDFAAGKTRRISKVPGNVAWMMSVSPDERMAIYGVHAKSEGDLMLAEGFR